MEAAAAGVAEPEIAKTLAHIHTAADVAALGGAAGIAARLGSDTSGGLSAEGVARNRAAYGRNKLADRQVRSFWSHLAEALEDETLRILLASAAFSITFAWFFSDNAMVDLVQGLAIMAAAVIVSGVNSFQNWSKDREFKALEELKKDFKVQVTRVGGGGGGATVSVHDVVVGDVVRVESGDRLPCDGVLLASSALEVDQSSMTGESALVRKSVAGDGLLIGGCIVQQGEGVYLATAVGALSRMGQTVHLVENEEEENTPLQDKLEELAGQIGKFGMVVGALTFAVLTALWVAARPPGTPLTDLLVPATLPVLLRYAIVGITIVVVAVPEGLPLAVTISLAFSMRRMMADNNLVRTLQSCETMGSATVIASDKTGTLTENRMEVVAGHVQGRTLEGEALRRMREVLDNAGAARRLGLALALNSTASLKATPGKFEYVGSPTEAALLFMMLRDLGLDYSAERAAAGRPLARRPFSTEYKYMSSLYPASGGPALYVKGAPEVVLDMCTAVQSGAGVSAPMTPDLRDNLNETVTAMARRGLRTLAVAFRHLRPLASGTDVEALLATPPYACENGVPPSGTESECTLLGLFGIADPLREGVPAALASCAAAGIRVIMVTGDHRDTATHIATQCGILAPGLEVMEGPAFRKLAPEARAAVTERLAVLARSSPADKHLLVSTLKAAGEVVAVTGDGTNDAPALRAADVGLAMGIAGTEVAKEASDIVILDDRFASIVASVRWGRSIKENIRKFLTFQLTINIVALTLTFVTACANGGDTDSNFPITPVQLLWVNLIMDSFAALALATEPPSDRLMAYPPHGKGESLITRTMAKHMVGHAAAQSALLLTCVLSPDTAARLLLVPADARFPNTAVFNTFVWLQVFNLFNCRTVHDEWNVLAGVGDSVIFQAILGLIAVMQVVLVQFGGAFFQTDPLSLEQWVRCVAIGAASIVVGYLLKLIPACDRQLRALAPHARRTPSGLLYGEASATRGALLRTLSTEASSELTTGVQHMAEEATAAAAAAAAAAGGNDDDAASTGSDGPGGTPRRSRRLARRDSEAYSGPAAGDNDDIDYLVASPGAGDGTSAKSRAARRRRGGSPPTAAAPPAASPSASGGGSRRR